MNHQKEVFLCTTPLQYFNATNIKSDGYKVCILNRSFNGGDQFYQSILKNSRYWDEVICFDSWKCSYKWILKNKSCIKNIYIDSDNGILKTYFLFRIFKVNIYVYEEGIGNYDFLKKKSNIKSLLGKMLNNLIGNKNFLGGGVFTKGIYIYDTEKHKEKFADYGKEIFKFNNSFKDHLRFYPEKNILIDSDVMDLVESLRGSKVLIYLTAWTISDDIYNILTDYDNYYKILKPHPHIHENLDGFRDFFERILVDFVFLEAFIFELLELVDELVIVHHNSSAIMYMDYNPKLKSILIK